MRVELSARRRRRHWVKGTIVLTKEYTQSKGPHAFRVIHAVLERVECCAERGTEGQFSKQGQNPKAHGSAVLPTPVWLCFLSRQPTALAVPTPAVPGHPAPLQQPAALRHCAVRARQSRNDGAAAPPPDRPDGRRGRVRRRRLLGRDLQLHQGRRDAARSSVQRVAARRERHVHGDDADLEEGRRRLRWHGQQGRRRVPLHLRQLRLLQRLLRRADALEHDEDELGLGDVGQRRRPQPRWQPHADDSPDQPH